MDNSLKEQLDAIKQLKGAEKEKALLELAQEQNLPQAYNELGIYYRETNGDNQKAVEMFQKALSIKEDAAVYTNLASAYFNLSQADTKERDVYMKQTVEAFKASARLNSASYFFLGNLYMPKVNAPFPDDYERAVSYYMQIEKEKGAIWAQAMKNVGMYYYHQKKDYISAAAYLMLAKNADPKDKKTANYYEYAFGKVNGRKFWTEKFKQITDQHDIAKVVAKGLDEKVLRCPKCGSKNCSYISVYSKLQKMMTGSFGFTRFKNYVMKYQCNSCKHQW